MAAKARTQADYRRDMNPRDQFGRKWLTTIELMTGEPTGGIVPAGWSDPLRTPMQYLKVPRNADGQSELGRLVLSLSSSGTLAGSSAVYFASAISCSS